jgi:hypothetical protein
MVLIPRTAARMALAAEWHGAQIGANADAVTLTRNGRALRDARAMALPGRLHVNRQRLLPQTNPNK